MQKQEEKQTTPVVKNDEARITVPCSRMHTSRLTFHEKCGILNCAAQQRLIYIRRRIEVVITGLTRNRGR